MTAEQDNTPTRRTVAVLELPLDKYYHGRIVDDTPRLSHRYVCLDCGRLLPVARRWRWLHSLLTCPG